MEGVIMISRHRQWRAWQFGVRHSGLWRNSGSSSSGSDGPCNPDDWKKNLLIGAVMGLVIGGLLFISPELFGKVVGFLFFIWIVSLIVRIFL